jgi:hypothetical protein
VRPLIVVILRSRPLLVVVVSVAVGPLIPLLLLLLLQLLLLVGLHHSGEVVVRDPYHELYQVLAVLQIRLGRKENSNKICCKNFSKSAFL